MVRKLIFLDIDNTLYPWGSYFAPCFRAMVHAIAPPLGVKEEQLYEEFKAVYAEHKSLEYAFPIQELASVKNLEVERVKDLVRRGRGAFLRVQRTRLHPYPGVRETLGWLKEQGHLMVGVTNAPMFLAQKRLFTLNLDSFLDGLVAWEGFDGATDISSEGFVPASNIRKKTRIKALIALPLDDCKPSENHYKAALREFKISPGDAFVVGDSVYKDLAPAAKLGMQTIWARYGSGFDPENRDDATLLRITHWDQSKITNVYDGDSVKPDWVIDSFDELKSIVPVNVPTLF